METQVNQLLTISRVFELIHNIPANIIDQIWPCDEDKWINSHLKSKYWAYCSREGYASPNAVLSFFASLDSANKQRFCAFFAALINKQF